MIRGPCTRDRHHRYVNEVSDQTELMMLNLDNDYKIMQLERQQYRGILKKYEKTWLDYHVRKSNGINWAELCGNLPALKMPKNNLNIPLIP